MRAGHQRLMAEVLDGGVMICNEDANTLFACVLQTRYASASRTAVVSSSEWLILRAPQLRAKSILAVLQ